MLHVQLSEDHKRKLRKIAKTRGVSMTEVVEGAIERMPVRGETRGGGNRTTRRA